MSETPTLPDELSTHLKISKFCNKVTKSLYTNSSDPIGLVPEKEQPTIMSILRTEYQDLETSVAGSISCKTQYLVPTFKNNETDNLQL
jgi:hypothetical protein